jgi:hypothetical protein
MAAYLTLKNLGLLINVYYAMKITKEAYDGINMFTSAAAYVGSWIWPAPSPPKKEVEHEDKEAFELVLLPIPSTIELRKPPPPSALVTESS